jgi:uncharacterized membrane protein (UPF0127 family)
MPHVLTPLLRDPASRWHLVNETRGTTLATHLEAAVDSETRRKGLLGRESLAPGHALIIAPCNAVHTFFMRFPIDIVFVRRDGSVAGVREAVRPWRMAAAWGGFATIELPAGAAAAAQVVKGDRLVLVRTEERVPANPTV